MIGIASDHGGFSLKQEIISFFKEQNIDFIDFGPYSKNSVDYPIYAKKVTDSILTKQIDTGILICGTGIGMSICANKVKGIRAALCHDVFSAKATREHNDANVLVMGERVIGFGLALEIVKEFFNTDFSNENRHIKRINMIEE